MLKVIKSVYKWKSRDKIKRKQEYKILLEFCECIVIMVFLIIGSTSASKVVDSMDQKTIKFSDYCPKIGACAAGSHILCSHFNPNSRFGETCVEPENIKMTPLLATYILQVLNAMRARLVQGIEVGKEKLPKAYGMIRLQWDLELATFAQLWADTCLRHESACQATKRFYDPEPIIINQKLKYPSWDELTSKTTSTTGMNDEKLYGFVTNGLKYLFSTKNTLTAAEVNRIGYASTQYKTVVNSDVTHVGCGISGFTKYQTWDRENVVKNFKFVCYVSARTKAGKPLYRTSPPRPTDTQKCGCVPGYKEDEDCLCVEDDEDGMCGENNEKCKPPVVLLPIITFEDMPKKNVSQSNNVDYSSSIARRFNGLSTLVPREKPNTRQSKNLFAPTEFDTSKKSLMKINIAPVKELTGARGSLNKYLEKIRNAEESDDYLSFDDEPINPGYTISNFINTKLGNFNSTGSTVHLVSLLDKVEDEIRGSKLNSDTIRMIEDKIRKIYGTVLFKNYIPPQKVNHDKSQIGTNELGYYNLVSNDKLKPFTSDLMDLKDFGPIKSNGANYEAIGDAVHRIKNLIHNAKGTQTSTDILDDEDVLSDDRKKYYEDMLHSLKQKKAPINKTFLNEQGYILKRPVQRLRPSHHTMQKELSPYTQDTYNSMDDDLLY